MTEVEDRLVRLCVPAEARYARVVRMTAASMAVVGEMGVDDVEDVRMAAEEGFVFACATRPSSCDVTFELADDEVRMTFSLGEGDLDESVGADIDLIELLLSAVCDDYDVSEDGMTLELVKKVGAHAE